MKENGDRLPVEGTCSFEGHRAQVERTKVEGEDGEEDGEHHHQKTVINIPRQARTVVAITAKAISHLGDVEQ